MLRVPARWPRRSAWQAAGCNGTIIRTGRSGYAATTGEPASASIRPTTQVRAQRRIERPMSMRSPRSVRGRSRGKKSRELAQRLLRDLFGEIVTRRQRAPAHVDRDRSPIVDRIEVPVHDAFLAPQRRAAGTSPCGPRRHRRRRARGRSSPPRGSPRTSHGSSRDRRSNARTRRTRAGRRSSPRSPSCPSSAAGNTTGRRRSGAPACRTAGSGRTSGSRPSQTLEVGLAVHEPRRRDVEHGHALDGVRMIDAQPVRDARSAIVARQPEAREAELAHDLHHVRRHRALRVRRMRGVARGLRRIAVAAQVGAHDGERSAQAQARPCATSRASADTRAAAAAAARCRRFRNGSPHRTCGCGAWRNPGKSSLIALIPSRSSRLAPSVEGDTGCAAATAAVDARAQARRGRHRERALRRAAARSRPRARRTAAIRSTGARATAAWAMPRRRACSRRARSDPSDCGARSRRRGPRTPVAIASMPAKPPAILDVGHEHIVELAGAHRLRLVGARDRFAAGRADAALVRELRQPRDRRQSPSGCSEIMHSTQYGFAGAMSRMQRLGAVDVEPPMAIDHHARRPRPPRRAPRTRDRARHACARRWASARRPPR